jgi:hypothetical protein
LIGTVDWIPSCASTCIVGSSALCVLLCSKLPIASGVPAERIIPGTVAAEFWEESFCELTIVRTPLLEGGVIACERTESTGKIVLEPDVGAEVSTPLIELSKPFAWLGACPISDAAFASDSADSGDDALTTCGEIVGASAAATPKVPADIGDVFRTFASGDCFLPPALFAGI